MQDEDRYCSNCWHVCHRGEDCPDTGGWLERLVRWMRGLAPEPCGCDRCACTRCMLREVWASLGRR